VKITKKQLQQIIKEEIKAVLDEQISPEDASWWEKEVAAETDPNISGSEKEDANGMPPSDPHGRWIWADRKCRDVGANRKDPAYLECMDDHGASDINEAGLADRAAGRLKQLLTQKPVRVILNRMKTVLDSQGKPGSSGRIEEIAALLGPLGITVADLIKIVSGMKGEEKNQPEQSSDMSL